MILGVSSSRLRKKRFGNRSKIIAALLCLTVGIVILALCSPATPSSPCAVFNTDFATGAGASYSPLLGTPEHVPVSEDKTWCSLWNTEQGSITYAIYVEEPIPLCLDASDMGNWVITATVVGGYEPKDGSIDVYQWKEQNWGTYDLDWTWIRHIPCDTDIWQATVDPADDTLLSLDSSIYPNCSSKAGQIIPGKQVSIHLDQTWTGCGQINQDFTKILVQSASNSQDVGRWPNPFNGVGLFFFLF